MIQDDDQVSLETITKSLKEGFEKAGKVLDKMHDSIKDLKAVHTKDFIKLYEKKKEIECKVLNLLAAYDAQVNLTNEMIKAQEIVEAAQKLIQKMNKKFQIYTMIKRWIRVSTDYYNTLCGAPRCYEFCHEKCELDKPMNPETFKGCSGVGGECCKTCGHDSWIHYHNEVKMIEETKTVPLIDDEMKKSLKKLIMQIK